MKYEAKKLLRTKVLWIVFIMLLAADLVLLSESAGHQDSYSEDYLYSAADYRQFLGQIPEQTKEFLEQPAYKNHNTFLYRNLMKTQADYSRLEGKGFAKGKYTAFNRYGAYPYHLLFVILFTFIAAYQMIPAERRRGYFLLLKSTERGRAELYAGKITALCISAAAFSLLCDLGEILFLRCKYGGFHFNALLQSASAYRNCPYDITIGQAVAVTAVARAKYIQFEFENKDGGLSKLEMQRDTIVAKKGVQKYFFDEAALEKQFSDVNTDIFLFMISGIALVIILCGMESYDAAMHPLLNTTAAGYAAVRKRKVHTALAVSTILYVLWNIPDFLTYFRIDHGKNLLASLSLLTNYAIRKPVTELLFFIILAAVRYAVFMAFTVFVIKLTGWYKNQAAVGVTGVLVILMTTLICYLLKTDVVNIIIRIFTKIQPV